MDVVTGAVEEHTGIAANLGKTRVFNFAGGPAPALVAYLGPDVWRGDLPPSERGLVALGTPIGTAEYTRAWAPAFDCAVRRGARRGCVGHTLQACLGEPAEDADCHARNIAYSLLILAGLVLHRPSAHPLLPIGLHGPMVSVCSRRGARPSQNGLSGH